MQWVVQHCVHQHHPQMVLSLFEPTVDLTMLVWGEDDYVSCGGYPDIETQLKSWLDCFPVEGGLVRYGYVVLFEELFDVFWSSVAGHEEWLYHKVLQ